MYFLSLKLLAAGSFLLLGLIFGLIPIFVQSCRKNQRILAFLNAFSAGVFFSVAVIHTLEDADEEFQEWKQESDHDDYFPLPYFLVVLCYFFILFIERVVFGKYQLEEVEEEEIHLDPQGYNELKEDDHNEAGRIAFLKRRKCVLDCSALFCWLLDWECTRYLRDCRLVFQINLGIGAAYAKKVKYGKKGACILVIIFSVISPIGVLVGLALNEASKLATSTLTAAAVGMFIYVAVEVSTDEFMKKKDRWKKFLCLLVGVALIIGTTFLE